MSHFNQHQKPFFYPFLLIQHQTFILSLSHFIFVRQKSNQIKRKKLIVKFTVLLAYLNMSDYRELHFQHDNQNILVTPGFLFQQGFLANIYIKSIRHIQSCGDDDQCGAEPKPVPDENKSLTFLNQESHSSQKSGRYGIMRNLAMAPCHDVDGESLNSKVEQKKLWEISERKIDSRQLIEEEKAETA